MENEHKIKCPLCHTGIMRKTIRKCPFSYKGHTIFLNQPGMWCNQCDEGMLTGEEIAATEKSFEDFKNNLSNT